MKTGQPGLSVGFSEYSLIFDAPAASESQMTSQAVLDHPQQNRPFNAWDPSRRPRVCILSQIASHFSKTCGSPSALGEGA